MTPAQRPPAIRRILVTLDSAEAGQPALDIAVRLAAALGAELEGVFIENSDLIRLSGLPFLREVRPWSLVEEVLSTERMQRDLRVLARQAERMLLQATQAMGVGCRFRVWRGRKALDMLNAQIDADILSVRGGGSSNAYRMIAALGRRRAPAGPAEVTVLYGDSPGADTALVTACLLARDLDANLRILLPAQGAAAARQRAGEILAAHGRRAAFSVLAQDSVAALTASLGGPGADAVLVAEVEHPLFRAGGIGRCLETFTGSVLLVRWPPPA